MWEGKKVHEKLIRHTCTHLQAYSRGCFYFIDTLRARVGVHVCVCGLRLRVTFVDFVSSAVAYSGFNDAYILPPVGA